MNILAIDTTTKIASVSIKKNNEVFDKQIDNKITHSEKLLPLIDECLKTTNTSLSEIDIFGCINGPGSFTGIRIGLSTIKAFSHVLNTKIFSISTLECLAIKAFIEQIEDKKKDLTSYIATFIDARNNRVYFSLYKLNYSNSTSLINVEKILDISNSDFDEAILDIKNNYNALLFDNSFPVIFTGDVIIKNSEKIVSLFGENVILSDLYPNSEDVINAFEKIENKDKYIKDAFLLDAEYARLSQAERTKSE